MAVRRKGKLLSRKRMRLINVINSWRRFVSGKEKCQAKVMRRKVREMDI